MAQMFCDARGVFLKLTVGCVRGLQRAGLESVASSVKRFLLCITRTPRRLLGCGGFVYTVLKMVPPLEGFGTYFCDTGVAAALSSEKACAGGASWLQR